MYLFFPIDLSFPEPIAYILITLALQEGLIFD